MADGVVLRFDSVTFEYSHKKPLLDGVSFSVRSGSKFTLMGQNGAGKSSLFQLIIGELKPESGRISIDRDATVAIAKQILPREQLDFTIEQYFAQFFASKQWNLSVLIEDILKVVHLPMPSMTKTLREFSGGQQARLLLAGALIQKPDILLLDEPTNNLDAQGIAHLTQFLIDYPKTCLVISHDAEFLNAFTQGVLYLDIFTHKIEQYSGDYSDVVEEIARRIEKEQQQNVRLERTIREKKSQAEVFAHKGGKLRSVAKKMRDLAQELEENKADVRREDKTLPSFEIDCDSKLTGVMVQFHSVSGICHHEEKVVPFDLTLKKNTHLIIIGPNGIGKSTLLESIASGDVARVTLNSEAKVGYYRQDFSTLNFNQTIAEELLSVMEEKNMEKVYKTAARFLLPAELVQNKIETLSEGQKGLLMFAKLFAMQPDILILDEPTNHINFRHLPVIADALDAYRGTLILVSHSVDFVSRIRIDEVIDLESMIK